MCCAVQSRYRMVCMMYKYLRHQGCVGHSFVLSCMHLLCCHVCTFCVVMYAPFVLSCMHLLCCHVCTFCVVMYAPFVLSCMHMYIGVQFPMSLCVHVKYFHAVVCSGFVLIIIAAIAPVPCNCRQYEECLICYTALVSDTIDCSQVNKSYDSPCFAIHVMVV